MGSLRHGGEEAAVGKYSIGLEQREEVSETLLDHQYSIHSHTNRSPHTYRKKKTLSAPSAIILSHTAIVLCKWADQCSTINVNNEDFFFLVLDQGGSMHFAAIITQKSKRKFCGMEFREGLHAKTFYHRHNHMFNLKHTMRQVCCYLWYDATHFIVPIGKFVFDFSASHIALVNRNLRNM